jgi:hypothetical protein
MKHSASRALAYSSTLNMKATCSFETSTVFGLHDVISQKAELFIITAVRASNFVPSCFMGYCPLKVTKNLFNLHFKENAYKNSKYRAGCPL